MLLIVIFSAVTMVAANREDRKRRVEEFELHHLSEPAPGFRIVEESSFYDRDELGW